MRNPPDFVVYVILGRWNKDQFFVPWGTPETGPAGITGKAPFYSSKRGAEAECKRLRKYVGKGNCYVQQYGPIS
jgi:hypothetical protein